MTHRFKFGDFEFDPETGLLSRNGQEVKLQRQPALVLGVLLARRDQTVSREDLKQAIWGNDTHVDFEKGLNFCMGQVRAALRDDAFRPVYIRTEPKCGYRFIAPVISIAPVVLNPPGKPVESGNVVRSFQAALIRRPILALAAIILALVSVALLLRTMAPSIPNLAVVRFDADTSAPSAGSLAEELTDDVTIRLASGSNGHYRVIGNAGILRVPRERRDLRTIGSSLRCKYAVLGQVRIDGDRVLVLAHLIRLSDLTHIRVVRFERKASDPANLESQIAAEIASQFAATMNNRPDSASLFRAETH